MKIIKAFKFQLKTGEAQQAKIRNFAAVAALSETRLLLLKRRTSQCPSKLNNLLKGSVWVSRVVCGGS